MKSKISLSLESTSPQAVPEMFEFHVFDFENPHTGTLKSSDETIF